MTVNRERILPFVWSFVTAALSLAASTLGGRSLWIDEIMRCLVPKTYTVGQLLACKHLSDFDSQSPIGYVLWRPVQSLLGIETGGFLLSALAAAIITWCALAVARRWKGAALSPLASAVIALNPLLVYYGGELWFYAPWAAAFAVAFLSFLEERPWRTAVAGLFFVAFHFAGIFVWFVFAVFGSVFVWTRYGFKRALRFSPVFAAPALVCAPLYLKAQFAAAHLDSQGVQWSRLASAPSFLWQYFTQIFPSLTGGWWFGVALLLVGFVLLLRTRYRAEAVLALGSAVGCWLVYTTYTYLRGYGFLVGRFWVFALVATLPLVAYACERLAERHRALHLAGILLLLADVLATTAVLQMDGRPQPMRRFAAEMSSRAEAVVFPNSYDIRPFRQSYPVGNGVALIVPAYWEQGEQVREQGLRLIREIAPFCAAHIGGNGTVALAEKCGWTSTNRVCELRTPIQRLAIRARIFPEPSNFPLETENQIVFPTEDELKARAESEGRPVFVPGRGWRLVTFPPQRQEQPFTPALVLGPGQKAELKVYVPKSCPKDRLTLNGFLGRGRGAASRYSQPLKVVAKGDYASVTVYGGKEGCYFLGPKVTEDYP